MTIKREPYQPTTVISPGETIAEFLTEQDVIPATLAAQMEQSLETIDLMINGQTAITTERATLLERIFGVPADYWINHEREYRTYLASDGSKDNRNGGEPAAQLTIALG
ncbi:MAG: hypothetical protein KDD92_19310 [Caldilineaceae bacterium]|nr:hypothetical protein [Caldilineaceae bacterium]